MNDSCRRFVAGTCRGVEGDVSSRFLEVGEWSYGESPGGGERYCRIMMGTEGFRMVGGEGRRFM